MPRGKDLFDEDSFDRRFNQIWERNEKVFAATDKFTRHPWLTFLGVIGLNLLLFAACVGIVAFFVWLIFF